MSTALPPANNETIAAQATPGGKGGVGIIRLSGQDVTRIATQLIGGLPPERLASFSDFLSANGETIDQGLAIYFKGPASFTGEDILELQGHGGPVVMSMLLARCVELGARIARPGEFSERAFLNGKIDLAQAEAIADLIDSASQTAAKSAVRSLQGEFSNQVHELVEKVTRLRIYVEAAIDFPEEEIDFLADENVALATAEILEEFRQLASRAKQGALLREGVSVVLAGRPNAGKSSLMNLFSGKDLAIVTEVPGTTRDVIDNFIELDGLPVRLIDTAGLRDATDRVEVEGVKRALAEIELADHIVVIVDADANRGAIEETVQTLRQSLPENIPVTVAINKIDLNEQWLEELVELPQGWLPVSAKTGAGIDDLKAHLKHALGYEEHGQGAFISRARHLQALDLAEQHVRNGSKAMQQGMAGELFAEDLRLCQQALGEITGEVSNDDLLGLIFSSFCIGK